MAKKKLEVTNTQIKRFKDIAAKIKHLDEDGQIRWLMGYAAAMDEGVRDHTKAMQIADTVAQDIGIILEKEE